MQNHGHDSIEGIAIIGMACRFPGARTIDQFWRNLCAGVESITHLSDAELLEAGVDPALLANPKYVKVRPIIERVDHFDAAFFGYSPSEAAQLDPQQRFFLECSWEALEDAGYDPARYEQAIGVFGGAGLNTYMYNNLRQDGLLDIATPTNYQMFISNDKDFLATRVAYKLNLRGPSLTIQTACSTSLVATHMACQSLLGYECDLALAGGVTLTVPQKVGYLYQEGMIASPDGHVRTFDAQAQGAVFGSGVGVVLLKRLEDALNDGDQIYAVIRGSALNNDGAQKVGYTAPSVDGQAEVIALAQSVARVSPDSIGYVEAHGTATRVGDPIEVAALTEAFRVGSERSQFCALGSVKTNIGHLDAAAGVAGLIKVALMLKHRQLPPSLHFETPNPDLNLATSPFYINTRLADWPAGPTPRRAGVSAFGIGGTNAHAILEEPPARPATPQAARRERPFVLALSARCPETLRSQAATYAAFLQQDAAPLADLCASALRRRQFEQRLTVAGHDRASLAASLEAFARGEQRVGMSSGQASSAAHKLVFVFPGQGSQWLGMGRQLLAQEPAFRAVIEQCDAAFRAYVDWSLLEELAAAADSSRLAAIDVVQPTLFAIEVALAALWRSWGISPAAVIGHSMGEVAASYVAGALSLDDAARIICRRSQLLLRVSGQGAMLVVELPVAAAQAALAGLEDQVAVAVSNSPQSTVLSGAIPALDTIQERLQAEGVFCRRVKVDVASHSPQVDPLRDDLLAALAGLQPRAGQTPIYSTVSGLLSDGHDYDADYWTHNLRKPVLFAQSVRQAASDGHTIFIEMSPHPILMPAVREVLQDAGLFGLALPSLRRQEDEQLALLESLGAIHAAGQPLDWELIQPQQGGPTWLPPSPWQHERHWIERSTSAAGGRPGYAGGHPLLGLRISAASQPDTHYWECELGLARLPYLAGHRIQDSIVAPGAAYVEMALAAAAEVFGPGAHRVEQIAFRQMLIVPEQGTRTLQLTLVPLQPGSLAFQIFSRPSDSLEHDAWVAHAEGTLRAQSAASAEPTTHESASAIQARCPEQLTGEQLYAAMDSLGYHYGAEFQGVAQLWRSADEALARLQLPEGLAGQDYQIHPALLDALFQLPGAVAIKRTSGAVYLPVGSAQLRQFRPASGQLWGYARLANGPEDAAELLADLALFDDAGQLVLEARDFRLQQLDANAGDALDAWFYTLDWQPQERAALPASEPAGRWLLLCDGQGVGQALRALLEGAGEPCVLVAPGAAYVRLEAGQYQIDPEQPAGWSRLLEDAFGDGGPACCGVIHAWAIDTPADDALSLAALRRAEQLGPATAIQLIQALAQTGWRDTPRLWLLTRGAQALADQTGAVAYGQAPLWGLARTVVHEHPELRCSCIDLSPASDPAELAALAAELRADSEEDQLILRGSARYVARLNHAQLTNASARPSTRVPANDQPFQLTIDQPGRLDQLTLRVIERRSPGPGEVEIAVHAAGLNFLDVLQALGALPPEPGLAQEPGLRLGAECAGVVTAVGAGVTELQVGQPVIALAAGCFRSFVTTDATLVVPKPSHLSYVEAATIPIVFLTVYHALQQQARLAAGERVLIHAGTGGVGLAAIQLAQRCGAEVFATAGSPAKRELLHQLGVAHTFDSRSLSFVEGVLAATDGEGVDVVLNSLGGEFIPASFGLLRDFGRFIELGKRDYYDNRRLGLQPFLKSLSFSLVDLRGLSARRPSTVRALFLEVIRLFEQRELTPIAHQAYAAAQASEAFHQMAQARHTGKLVIDFSDRAGALVEPASQRLVHPDATYLITGGLGGLGLTFAQWLVEQGARSLALVGRSAASPAALERLAPLEGTGAQISLLRADVSQPEQVAALLEQLGHTLPPLRGIIHAAGLLDDSTLLHMDLARLRSVMAPKQDAAWNLHQQTSGLPLDFFVSCSSASGLLGSPGQANYGAANAFLDALAQHRHRQGQAALSISWGPWAEVGLSAADSNRGERLAFRGIASISPRQGARMLARLLDQPLAHVGALSLNLRQWCQFYPEAATAPFLAPLLREQAQGSEQRRADSPMRQKLQAASPSERLRPLEQHIAEQLAQVLRLDPQQVGFKTPFTTLGLDSLMSLEIRNRLELSLGLTLSAALIWAYPTVTGLAGHLLEKLGLPISEPPATETPPDALEAAAAQIEHLSDDEMEQLLLQKLSSLTGS